MKLLEFAALGIRYRKDPFYVKYLNSKRLLDVGCGRGEFLEKDPQRFVGIDLDPALIAQCKAKALSAETMSAMKMSFSDRSFDVVRAAQLVEHFTPSEACCFLSEAERVLRPGGVVYLTTPGVRNVWHTFSHIRPYPPTAFRKLLNSHTEHYVKSHALHLQFVGAWGTRCYTTNRFLTFVLNCLDLLLPPINPIGWTIILQKPLEL